MTVRSRNTTPKTITRARELKQNMTDAETRLWFLLRAHRFEDIHFRRQHPIGPYVVDFCAPRQKLVIEVDGSQHTDQVEYDRERTAFLEARGYRVIRFWNHDVLKKTDAVLLAILHALQEK